MHMKRLSFLSIVMLAIMIFSSSTFAITIEDTISKALGGILNSPEQVRPNPRNRDFQYDRFGISINDAGLIDYTGQYRDGPLSNQGEKYISFRGTSRNSGIQYCYIIEPREFHVLAVSDGDVVIDIKGEVGSCKLVLMSKKQFVAHRQMYQDKMSNRQVLHEELRIDEYRLRDAKRAWSNRGR